MKSKEIIRNIGIIIGVIILSVVLVFFSRDNKKVVPVDTNDIVIYKVDYYMQNKDTQEYELLTSKTHNNYVDTEITVTPDEFDDYQFIAELSTTPLTITLYKSENIRFELYYRYIGN